MPQSKDLMGLGESPNLAGLMGNNPQPLTAAGTNQGTAAAIKDSDTLVEMTATGADGITFQATALVGTPYWVINSSGFTGNVYVPSGHTLNTTLNGVASMTTHQRRVFIQYKAGFWLSINSA